MPATVETTDGRVLAHLPGGPDGIQWLHSGIFYTGTVRMEPKSAQCLFRLEGAQRVIGGIDECLEQLSGATPDDLAVLIADGLHSRLVRVDPATGSTAPIFEPQNGDIRGASVVGRHWAAIVSAPDQPPEIVIDGRQVTRHAATGVAWARQQEFRWQAKDGLDLDGVLLLPTEAPSKPLPTVFLIHGGPYGTRYTAGFQHPGGTADGASNFGQVLATAGFAVVMPNYRGGFGRGDDFARMGSNGGVAPWGDITAAVDAAIERGVADAEHLGIGGWSYGGYMSAVAVGTTNRFKAAMVGAALTSHTVQWMGSDMVVFARGPSRFRPWEGELPDDVLDPIRYVPQVSTPVLVMHGGADIRVPLMAGTGYHRALRELGKTTELVIYPGEPHTIRGRHHRVDMFKRLREWYSRWLA
jgi:dipeptidyl aminopeptidase/acylaminoacyl peptidase